MIFIRLDDFFPAKTKSTVYLKIEKGVKDVTSTRVNHSSKRKKNVQYRIKLNKEIKSTKRGVYKIRI